MWRSRVLSTVLDLDSQFFMAWIRRKTYFNVAFKLRQEMFYCYTSIHSTCCINFSFWWWVWWFVLGRHHLATCSTCLYNKDVSLLSKTQLKSVIGCRSNTVLAQKLANQIFQDAPTVVLHTLGWIKICGVISQPECCWFKIPAHIFFSVYSLWSARE